MATKMVRVNSLAVAKRWLKEMREVRHPLHYKKIGIWELQPQGRGDYSYSDSTIYIVGNQTSVKAKINNLGKRLDV